MKIGDLIKVVDWQHNTLSRRVVKVCGNLVFVCTDQEFKDAKAAGREPLMVGWPRESVMAPVAN